MSIFSPIFTQSRAEKSNFCPASFHYSRLIVVHSCVGKKRGPSQRFSPASPTILSSGMAHGRSIAPAAKELQLLQGFFSFHGALAFPLIFFFSLSLRHIFASKWRQFSNKVRSLYGLTVQSFHGLAWCFFCRLSFTDFLVQNVTFFPPFCSKIILQLPPFALLLKRIIFLLQS